MAIITIYAKIANTLIPGVNAKTMYNTLTNVEFQLKYVEMPPRTPEITLSVDERYNFFYHYSSAYLHSSFLNLRLSKKHRNQVCSVKKQPFLI